MKTILKNILVALFVAFSLQAHAQGFIYDQQSATSPAYPIGNGNVDGLTIQTYPLTQAFIPALSAINFVQLEFEDVPNNGANGATVYVNLWAGSSDVNSATFLGSTTPVYMPDGFVTDNLLVAGVTNFYFPSLITLTAGQTYYLQPVVLSGDNPWAVVSLDNNTYLGGGLYFSGVHSDNTNLWFREGIVVPEPTTLVLIGVSSLFVLAFKRRKILLPIIGLFITPFAHAGFVYYLQSMGGVGSAPLPINVNTNAPIEEVGPGVFLIEDGEPAKNSGFHTMSYAGSPIMPGGTNNDNGTNQTYQPYVPPIVYGSNDLWLSITSVSNGISQIVIHPPWDVDLNNTNWSLLYSTNLSTPISNWLWVMTTDYGQTNLSVANAIDANGFYALGNSDTNGRPPAQGNFLYPCPNTRTLVSLQPQGPSYTYTILTYPTNGYLTGVAPTNLFYTATNADGGMDSFNFKVNDGTNDSAPATVTFYISPDYIFANEVDRQICRGGETDFWLAGGSCNGSPGYGLLSLPAHGLLSGALPHLTYTATNTTFTGYDVFGYSATNGSGQVATNVVVLTVGEAHLVPQPRAALTGTNQPVAITLTGVDQQDGCRDEDASNFTYTVTTGPTNGYLTGTSPNLIYTPTNGERADAFQFTDSDGALTYPEPATVNLYAVNGPALFTECNPFNTKVRLEWQVDDAVQQMEQQNGLYISYYTVYRATNSGGTYYPIAYVTNQTAYLDTNTIVGQTNYYAVTFEFYDNDGHQTYESPASNEIAAAGQNPDDLIPPDAVWDVTDISTNPPVHLGRLQAPFSNLYTNQYPALFPLPNAYWPASTNADDGVYSTWSNHITFYIPSNSVPLAQVQYAIAIDNDYRLYLNDATNAIDATNHWSYADWPAFQAFENVAPGRLHAGTNDLGVVIVDEGNIDYFSLVVTTNTCGQ